MADKPSVLAVAPWTPSVQRPRSLGLLGMLSEHTDLTLICATWNDADRDDLVRLAKSCRVVQVPCSRGPAVLRAVTALADRLPLQQAYVGRGDLADAIRNELRRRRVDMVYFNVLRSAHLRDLVPAGVPTVLDADEFRSEYYRYMSRHSRSQATRLISRIEHPRMAQVERAQFATFDRVIVSSPSDLHHPGTSLVRSPHVMPDHAPERPVEADLDIVFVGRMSYRANVEAIEFFTRSVLPLIHRSRPEVRVHIVGADPTREVRRLANDRIVVHGRVESVVEFYRRARVSIVPVQAATGVQMKLIESLHMGVPTVCTPVTASQAGIEPGIHCLTATDPGEWSSAVLGLLSGGPEARQMARAGAAWASSAYCRDTIESDLMGVVRGIGGVL